MKKRSLAKAKVDDRQGIRSWQGLFAWFIDPGPFGKRWSANRPLREWMFRHRRTGGTRQARLCPWLYGVLRYRSAPIFPKMEIRVTLEWFEIKVASVPIDQFLSDSDALSFFGPVLQIVSPCKTIRHPHKVPSLMTSRCYESKLTGYSRYLPGIVQCHLGDVGGRTAVLLHYRSELAKDV